jgi:hypothetical protein
MVPNLMIGKTLNHFKIMERAGKGGMGEDNIMVGRQCQALMQPPRNANQASISGRGSGSPMQEDACQSIRCQVHEDGFDQRIPGLPHVPQ